MSVRPPSQIGDFFVTYGRVSGLVLFLLVLNLILLTFRIDTELVSLLTIKQNKVNKVQMQNKHKVY